MDETKKKFSFTENKNGTENTVADKEFAEKIRIREIELLKTRVKILEDKEAIWNRERAALAESEAVWKEKVAILTQSLKDQVERSNFAFDGKKIVEFLESERAVKRARTT